MKAFNRTQTVLLECLSAALFEKQLHITDADWKAVFREANAHKVFPLVFDASKALVTEESLLQKAQKLTRRSVATTVNINYAHAELHRLMQKENIPYVTFKGLSSSLYYPHPELRVCGDVDFYVAPEDFERCEATVENAGFLCSGRERKHTSFEKNGLTYELHRQMNGIPLNDLGERLTQEAFGDLIATAMEYDGGQGTVKIPDKLHHGLILLLHTLSHMTAEGIGLRHLCDWAVFESSLSNEEFTALFEKPLKEFGLWRFAQLLSLCSVEYLGAPYRDWQGSAENEVLEAMILDILAAGNFGKKDEDRKGQIKYIADRGEFTQSTDSILKQAGKTIAKKAALENTSKAAVVAEYVRNVLAGKRKPDSKKTLDAAAQRKALYSEFHLFETDVF